ncbi:MAG: dTMP kinase [Candidatus Omnitrophota bacterium]
MRGIFITLEGPEGSGKSTHSKLLCDFLRRRGLKVIHVREPGGTRISEAVRKILLDKKNKGMTSACELFLFLACRAQIVDEIISPALRKGYAVVCDRFQDATVAYQGYGAGLDLRLIGEAGRLAAKGLKPNLTILLDVATKKGLLRAGMKDRVELKPYEFHRRVREGYLRLAKGEPKRIVLIRANGKIEEVQDKIRKAVSDVI